MRTGKTIKNICDGKRENHMKNQYIGDVGDFGKYSLLRFDAKCPDEGRVCIHGEVIED